ncbi:AAA domain-containing protein [Limibacter armeniacum]|uniref:DEAD/DEAH box helicase n=1 Tax=Limibacter armeniacum TaxID=466084 RepID=UPI002FE5236C
MAENPRAVEFFDELYELHIEDLLDGRQKYTKLKTLLEQICKDLTKDERMHTSNLFARLAFLGNKKKLSRRLLWSLHAVRITAEKVRKHRYNPTENEWFFAVQTVASGISVLYAEEVDEEKQPLDIPERLAEIQPDKVPYHAEPRQIEERIGCLRVEVLDINKEEGILLCADESNHDEDMIKVRFNVYDWNMGYNSTIEHLWEGAQLNLLEVYIDPDGVYVPKHLVLEPDYLIDVSAVAECFQRDGINPLLYLNKKFDETETSAAMQLGNVANFFLDELLNEDILEPVTFADTFKKTFKLYPLQYSTIGELNDRDAFMGFYKKAEEQFSNIRRVVREDLKAEGVNENNYYIEPAFYSEKYGFQGRLDLLHLKEETEEPHFDIFELKSSKSVPQLGLSRDGMWKNHQVQALIYRMLLQSVFDVEANQVNPSIFYSATTQQNLRFAPAVQSLEKEILNARNLIVARELQLARSPHGEDAANTLRLISERNFPNAPSFVSTKVRDFEQGLRNMTPLEREYLFSFVSFIAKEQQLSKIGDTEFSQGLASLWLDDFVSKADSFNIFYDLEIEENHADEESPYIIFKRTNEENSFVNFREGDIGVLYPREKDGDSVLKNQIFKCSIAQITKDQITVRFRFRQRNIAFFEQHQRWAIEHDVLDNGFTGMYRGLFSFLNHTSKTKKDILLGIEKPRREPIVTDFQTEDVLNEEERRIIGKALATKDYFLVVGPPGTGKTSRMLKNMTANLHANPDTNILLLAYTNRAVDEICESVDEAIKETADGKRKFIRIGQEFSTAPHWRDCLLDKVAAEASNRQELKDTIGKHRIFIGTLASITGKLELFKLKDFDIAIVDEASQILEPQIVGLLPRVNRFILIGDQKQLPAIVQQEPELSEVHSELLQDIGLYNRRNSYFERMFNRCKQFGWDWAYDMLTHQGRMHQELSVFSNQSFYDNKLTTVPLPWQHAELKFEQVDEQNKFEQLLSKHRLVYVPSKKKTDNKSDKINEDEAKLVVEMVKAVKGLYLRNGMKFDPIKTVGVITPYRNQIAQIRHELEKAGVEEAEQLTIDTVERYQGSQREVIIMSFCANTPFQVQNLMSLTDDGEVDRKLNVAITRARQQMVFVGNEELLSREVIFYRLIEWVKSRNGYLAEGIDEVLKHQFELPEVRMESKRQLMEEDKDFEEVFKELIKDPVNNHPRTKLPEMVMGADDHYLRNIVLNYGRADFDKPLEHDWTHLHFSPAERVDAYGYMMMLRRFYTAKWLFSKHKTQFLEHFEANGNKIFFFDFGCGPMTSGLAFNQVFRDTRKHFVFNYIGIDKSEAMLKKGKAFAKGGLLESVSYYNFQKALKDANWGYIQDCFSQPHTVILNFAYIFSSLELSEALLLVKEINRMVTQFPQNRYILISQSSISDSRNYNFKHFCERLKGIQKELSVGSGRVTCSHDAFCDYDKSEEVYFEVLSN